MGTAAKKLKNLILAVFLGAFIFPFLVLTLWSFSGGWAADALLPGALGLRGWRYLLTPGSRLLPSLGLSIGISCTVTLLALALSIPAGKALGLYDFKAKKMVEIIVLAPVIIPAITVGMGIHVLFIRYGLADTLIGVILAHLPVALPYGIRIFTSVYKALGVKWEEQAKVLKADKRQVFLHITLPFLYPGIVSAGALMFNVSFSQYFLTYLIGGGNIITLPLLLFPFVNSGDRVIASAVSLVFVVTSLIIMLVMEKMLANKVHKNISYYF